MKCQKMENNVNKSATEPVQQTHDDSNLNYSDVKLKSAANILHCSLHVTSFYLFFCLNALHAHTGVTFAD